MCDENFLNKYENFDFIHSPRSLLSSRNIDGSDTLIPVNKLAGYYVKLLRGALRKFTKNELKSGNLRHSIGQRRIFLWSLQWSRESNGVMTNSSECWSPVRLIRAVLMQPRKP